MSKHTTGPWEVDPLSTGEKAIVTTENEPIAIVVGGHVLKNADLIAAAPDLLNACKRAVAGFENTPPVLGEDRYEPILVLKAAIAKAEGKP